MSGLITKGNWQEIKSKLKKDYPVLTERDLTYKEGKEEQLIGELQKKMGKTKAEVSDMIRNLLDE